jgi:anti-anti-sigma factor
MEHAVLRPYVTGGPGRAFLRCWNETVSGTIVLHAEGEVDMATAPALEEAIRAAYQAAPRVIVDLSGLRHLDGSGIHVLEETSRANPTRFAVVGATRDIHRLFRILGLADSLPVVASLDAAHECFGRY